MISLELFEHRLEGRLHTRQLSHLIVSQVIKSLFECANRTKVGRALLHEQIVQRVINVGGELERVVVYGHEPCLAHSQLVLLQGARAQNVHDTGHDHAQDLPEFMRQLGCSRGVASRASSACRARPDADTGLSEVADLGQRKRRAFLGSRIQQFETFLAWCYDPKLSTAAAGTHNAPWWKHYAQTWMTRRRTPNEAIYFREQIEDAAARFRQQVDASRTLVADLTPLEILTAHEGSRLLAELVNKPGRPPWDGATGSGLNWRLATSELEAERRHLRLDGEPVILYSLLSPPARATANLLNDLYRLDSVMTVALEWRPWDLDAARRKIRGAQRHYFSKRYSMMAHVQETEGTASAMVDSAAFGGSAPRRAAGLGRAKSGD